MRKILVTTLVFMLIFSSLSSGLLIRPASAKFNGTIQIVFTVKETSRVIYNSGKITFEALKLLKFSFKVAVSFAMGWIVIQITKAILEATGVIDGYLQGWTPWLRVAFKFVFSLASTVTYEFRVESMGDDGEWTFDFEAMPYESAVGGFVVPVDKFGLLAPYVGLASTILVATVATAIYVRHVKRREEKQ